MEMEESKESPFQSNRFQQGGMHNINITEWNKKRKLQSYPLDLARPKHKCWVGSFSSDENPVLKSMHKEMVNSRTNSAFLDDRSEPESANSNSFVEDFDIFMSVNEEAKLEADCANTYFSDETFVDSKYNLEHHEECLTGLGSFSDYVKDNGDHSVDKEFEDFLFSNGVNPQVYVLSSGRLNVDQEAESSSTKPPTIDEEFEQYFSALML